MSEKKPCLSDTLQAVLTILIAAALLLCVAANNMFGALLFVLAMVALKFHVVRCYNRKIDKFYLVAYSLSAIVLAGLLL